MSMNHFSHRHKLNFNDHTGPRKSICCDMCGEEIFDREVYFSCKRCGFFLHKSCTKIPRVLSHPFHPQHTLTIHDLSQYSVGIICRACGNVIMNIYAHHCFDCNLDFQVKCISVMPVDSFGNHNSSHPHPLILCKESNKFDFQCSGCELSFDKGGYSSSSFIYVCLECKCLLHESCASLPQQLTNHPFHPLTLYSRWRRQGDFLCTACHTSRSGLSFKCSDCPFELDTLCATLMPTLLVRPADDQQNTSQNVRLHPHPMIHCDIRVTDFGRSHSLLRMYPAVERFCLLLCYLRDTIAQIVYPIAPSDPTPPPPSTSSHCPRFSG